MSREANQDRKVVPCVPSRGMVVVSFLILGTYSLLAYAAGRTLMQWFVEARVGSVRGVLEPEILIFELLYLWPILCIVGGWLNVRRLRGQSFVVRTSTIVFVPIWLAAVFSVYKLFDPGSMSRRMPRFTLWEQLRFPIMTWFIAIGSIVAIVLVFRIWRRWGLVGLCHICQYDLRGNVSGVCPECGYETDGDSRINPYFFKKEFKWFPELGEFDRPSDRQRAVKKAKIANLKSFTGIALIVAGFGPLIVALRVKDAGFAGFWCWEMGCAVVVYFATFWMMRVRFRRLLREQLDAQRAAIGDGDDVNQR